MSFDCRVLVLDDEESIRFSLSEILTRQGYRVEAHGDPFAALAALESFAPHVVVADYALPNMDGLEFMARVLRQSPDTVVIFMTAYGTEELAVEAMKAGAYDYFKKPFSNDAVLVSIAKAREKLELQAENRRLRDESGEEARRTFIGTSPAITAVFDMVHRIAGTGVTVLLQGESGTGKELIASAIHRSSTRAARPFVKLNCAAIPEALVESELFGYEAGAFTGANRARDGKFQAADGGTLFLDEIGDMSASAQTKVLRVLQEGEVERVGSNKVRRVDVRIIAATHQDLEARVAAGEFREDLYYRLNVVNLLVPPLRKRGADVRLLLDHYARFYAEKFGVPAPVVTEEDYRRFEGFRWPGNVRELENTVARGVLLGSLASLPAPGPARMTAASIPPPRPRSDEVEDGTRITELVAQELPYKEAKRRLLEDFERRYLLHVLTKSGWNVSKAARMGRLHRKNFWEKMQKHGLVEPGAAAGDEGSEA